MTRRAIALALAALASVAGLDAGATTVAITPSQYGQWQSFDVDNTLNAVATSSTAWSDQYSYAGDGSLLDFQFSGPAVLKIVDLGYAGDQFEIFDNGTSIGASSVVPAVNNDASSTVYTLGQADAAFADASFSSATFVLGAGSHDITGVMTVSALYGGSPLNATQGALQVQAVPEPASWLLMGAGLLFVVSLRRKGSARALAAAGALLGLAVSTGAQAASSAAAPVTVKIIAFNDFHGNLQSPGTFTLQSGTKVPVGGVDYLAAYVNQLKSMNPNHVVVHGGDLIGASPLISAFFHDEGAIEAMNQLGLDLSSVGNHEFDGGAAELLRKQYGGLCYGGLTYWTPGQNSCEGGNPTNPVAPGIVGSTYGGAKFRYLSANVVATQTISADGVTIQPNQTLFPAYQIKTFNGVRVAFIGMTLQATPTIVLPTGVAGLQFNDEASTVNALIPQLRARGVNAVVVVVHQGGTQGSTGSSYINDCAGGSTVLSQQPIASIVSRLDDGVDMVISAHSHQAYNCRFPNSVGRSIPVTQASSYGKVLTSVDLALDPTTGKVLNINPVNWVVDRSTAAVTPTGNPVDLTATNVQNIQKIVAGYNTLTSGLTSQVEAQITANVSSAPNPKTCEKVAGDMIADGQLQATAPAALGGAQIGFINAGGVRGSGFFYSAAQTTHPGLPDGTVTYGDAFTLQPFGNSLVTLTLTAADLRKVLEQQFSGCYGQSVGTNRVMDTSAGFAYQFDSSQACGAKIQNASLTDPVTHAVDPIVVNGTVLNPTKTYRVNVNNFLAAGGDNFTTFLNATNQLGGAQDIDSLVAYLANFNAPNPALNPAAITPRITNLNPAGFTDGSSCQ